MTTPKSLPTDLIDSLLVDYKKPEDLIGEHGLLKEDDSLFPAATVADNVPEKVVKEEKGTQQENIVKVSQPATAFFDTQLLTSSIDWSKISACLSNKSGCVCYGLSAERLVVPKESCELAVQNGWSKATKKT